MKPEDLPSDAQQRLARLPAELRDVVASAFPTPEAEAQARQDQEARDRQRLRDERQRLLQLADECELGVYGPLGIAAAKKLLATGRTDFNLSSLRSAVRKLRLTPAVAARGSTTPVLASRVRGER